MWRGGTTVVCQSYCSPAALYPLCTVQRLITAARLANKLYSDWGVTSTTAGQLSSTLNRCDFHFSVDISDAYHLALWAECGGGLRPIRRPVITSRGPSQYNEGSWVDALVIGCTPSTCRGGCDKGLSGILIDGFASDSRHASSARRPPVARGTLLCPPNSRGVLGRLPHLHHVYPEHSDCVGFKGGCAVCGEFYGRALKVQEMWVKARALNMPLSTKGQAVGRRGALAGLASTRTGGAFICCQRSSPL